MIKKVNQSDSAGDLTQDWSVSLKKLKSIEDPPVIDEAGGLQWYELCTYSNAIWQPAKTESYINEMNSILMEKI